jgi:hypothetical protein
MKKTVIIFLLILFSPLAIALFAIGTVVALGVSFYDWLWLICFCWRHADRVYFICSRRRGWEPFLKNNAIPVLPAHVSAVWFESPEPLTNVIRATRKSNLMLSKPFLILVTPFGMKPAPLNQRLLHLKHHGKASDVVRGEAHAIVNTVLADFSKCCQPEVA